MDAQPTLFDFRPVPREQRHVPARIGHLSVRLYPDKFVEHRRALSVLRHQMELHGHGEGSRSLCRAILNFRDTVIVPLEAGSANGATRELERAARAEFRPVPLAERKSPARVRNVAVRLLVDKYQEHREAHGVVQAYDLHGDVTKLVVRALNHYADTVLAVRSNGETSSAS